MPTLIFPHQLFEDTTLLPLNETVYMVEEWLFFKQYPFHKQKLMLHRASMQCYKAYLETKGHNVKYIQATEAESDVRILLQKLISEHITEINVLDLHDDWLEKRIQKFANRLKINTIHTPYFINSEEEIKTFYEGKKRYFQTDFYIHQRKKRRILLENGENPIGGQWTYDADNRVKYPKGKAVPKTYIYQKNKYVLEAETYVNTYFKDNYGGTEYFNYPTTFEEAKEGLQVFLKQRFNDYGTYQDAILSQETFMNHSLLTPGLNIGLLTPQYIINEAIAYASMNDVALNNLEGFIRQILGWREFIRAVYVQKGVQQRTTNFWNNTRAIPEAFWNGTTGIAPVDDSIRKTLKYSYAHHIERLMILGNFMLLCEFHPDEVYKWFSSLYIDAYDWVMVTNVYGMSQFADGGIMATKPYISGSNYIFKMSDYKKEPWHEVWDALFWRFMDKNRDYLRKNPRLAMLISTFDKWDKTKQIAVLEKADAYLEKLNN